jgi:cytochrome c1
MSARIVIAAVAVVVATAGLAGYGWHALSARQTAAIAKAVTGGDPVRAPVLLRRYGCAGCHTIPGVPGADGKVAPPLTELRGRVYIAGGLPNAPENMVRWIVAPQTFAPHAAMPATGITEKEARDVAAFLYTR